MFSHGLFQRSKKALSPPRSVSFRGLIQNFRRASPPLSYADVPPRAGPPPSSIWFRHRTFHVTNLNLRASSHGPGWPGDLGNWGSLPSHEHIENFTKDLEVRRDLGNGPAWPSPYEEALDKFDIGATFDSDSAPCVEPELSTTDSVELNAFTASI